MITTGRFTGAAFFLLIGGGQVFSQSAMTGRSTGVELRRPRQEAPVPSLEEKKHKFIHDGKRYDRAPNLFDVGGELKLLPEVFSELSFESRDFVDDGTIEQQKELRDSRFWGRLYIYGWPAPIQYLRSHFGGPPIEGTRPWVLADPLDACEPLRSTDLEAAEGPISTVMMIAERGKCTFATKAKHAQDASAAGLLIVNNEDGIMHPPGPDGKGLDIFSAMIPQAEGSALINVLRDGPAQGVLIPMNCRVGSSNSADKTQRCHPAMKADRELVETSPLGGFVNLPSGEKYEYLLAEFGVKVPSRELTLGSPQRTADMCTPPSESGLGKDKFVLAARGGCSFVDKAEAVAAGSAAGVGALIVVNNETSLFHMGASPRWRGANVSIPTLLVSDLAGEALSQLTANTPILLTASSEANAAVWEDIGRLRDAAAWPREKTSARQSIFETLLSQNTGFVDRVSAVQQEFSAVFGGGEARSGGGGEEFIDSEL